MMIGNSVPHRFARAEVEARLTARTLEIFARGERIAVHLRASWFQPYQRNRSNR
jgi:hypothetical protein